jgi:hypothetical protein
MILSAQLLDTFDRGGPRRFAFEREYEPLSISPLGLLYAAVEGSLVARDPVQGAKDAILERTQRLEVSAGDLSSLSAVRHVESMAEVIVRELRAKFGQMSRPEPIPLGEHEWQSNLFSARGEHHRIILVSHLDDDSLRSFAHSWGTIGELAALERGLTLTVVLIGAQRGGRRHSPWAKAFLHPVQKALRFAPRKRDDGFTANWKTCWREQTEIKAETWLERMKTDEVLEELIVSRKIQCRADDQRMMQARKDMLALIPEMDAARADAPMRRSACDEIGRGPCPFQPCCYSPTPATPEDFPHLYRLRGKPAGETAE